MKITKKNIFEEYGYNLLRLILINSIIFLSLNTTPLFAFEKQITLVTSRAKTSPEGIYLNLLYTEAFKRLGIDFVYGEYPANRATMMSNSGLVDGELSRVYNYNDIHPNVLRVEESHWSTSFIAVATDAEVKLDGWESLSFKNYSVCYRRGIKACESNLPRFINKENLQHVETNKQGYEKVLLGWANVFIGSEIGITRDLGSEEYRDSGLKIVGVMEETKSYAFLNIKYKDLIIPLSRVIKDLKDEGLIKKYWNDSNMWTNYETVME